MLWESNNKLLTIIKLFQKIFLYKTPGTTKRGDVQLSVENEFKTTLSSDGRVEAISSREASAYSVKSASRYLVI